MTPDQEQHIQALTQKLVGEQIGELVLALARLRAEALVRQNAAAVAERSGSQHGAQGADGADTESR
jgi:hypothetical protein